MPTLYRKYRPQAFADLTGQEPIVQTIENEVKLGKLGHAYLFAGPRGVGKTTMARLLAKAVNCKQRAAGTFEPCNTCQSCTDITANRAIDVLEIDAASHTGVDNVRENIIENARFQPTTAPYKVFIIDEVHMLSGSAFNALLKTLEEPPAHVIFILATTELHKLPATVLSRCQRFNFKKIPYDLMLARLKNICKEEGVSVDKEVLDRVVKKSDGCLRDAESLLGQILTLNIKKITAADAELMLPASASESVVTYLEFVLQCDTPAAFKLLNSLNEAGTNWDQFGLDILGALSATLACNVGAEPPDAVTADFSTDALKRIKTMAMAARASDLQRLTDAALVRRVQIKTAPLPELPLQLLAIEYATGVSAAPTPPSTPAHSAAPVSAPAAPAAPATPTAATPDKAPEEKSKAPKHSITESLKSAISTITRSGQTPQTAVEQIRGKWSELITAITAQNHSLTFILSMAVLTHIDSDGLHLTFPYSLHKEKIEEHKNRQIIEECLQAAFGEHIRINCSVQPNQAAQAVEADLELSGLAVEFGGEVIG